MYLVPELAHYSRQKRNTLERRQGVFADLLSSRPLPFCLDARKSAYAVQCTSKRRQKNSSFGCRIIDRIDKMVVRQHSLLKRRPIVIDVVLIQRLMRCFMANPPVDGHSLSSNVPGVSGENTGGGTGVYGQSGVRPPSLIEKIDAGTDTRGVSGWSEHGTGVFGESFTGQGVLGWSEDSTAIMGKSANGIGVYGQSGTRPSSNGESERFGVYGWSESSVGVYAYSNEDNGLRAVSERSDGVAGFSHADEHSGVYGNNDSLTSNGVTGTSENGRGLMGLSDNNIGIYARGATFAGVFEGNVAINGAITLNGKNLLTLIEEIAIAIAQFQAPP
jgi:hypothetical protein